MAATSKSFEDWVKEAVNKNYSAQDIRRVLLKNNYNHEQIMKVLSLHEKMAKPVPKGIFSAEKIKIEMEKPKGEVSEKYELTVDLAKVDVVIEKVPEGTIYSIYMPKIDVGTQALLDEVRRELISITAIGVGEIIDQKSVKRIKNNFMRDASNFLRDKVPGIQRDTEDFLVGLLMQDMLGLGKVEFLINDPLLEEIVIVNSKEIRVYHKKYGWLLTNITLASEDEVTNYANIIARRVGRQISILNPLLDAHVVTGDRANAVLHLQSQHGHLI